MARWALSESRAGASLPHTELRLGGLLKVSVRSSSPALGKQRKAKSRLH